MQTKFGVPVIREVRVARKQLVERLNAGLWQAGGFGRKLTLISAPAGFGKTTLAAEWIGGLKQRAAWLALDEADNDPARFVVYLIGALQQIDAKIGVRTLAMLRAGGSPTPNASLKGRESYLETSFTPLINDLAGLEESFVLALEDFHALHSPAIQRLVGFIVERQPRQMHLLIVSREDPLLPLARLRSQGQLCELRQEDLRFTEDETAFFLRQIMRFELSAVDLRALQRRTEGWAAGLQMAALSMQGQRDLPGFIRSFSGSNRYILDYLFEEVYAQQDVETQVFLVKTSLLGRLNAGLCDALLERNDSRRRLQALEHANLFISRIDPEGEWYCFHRLFQDLLSHQLQLQADTDEALLHRRAAGWLESHGQLPEAVGHAMAGGDWEAAADLVSRQTPGMLRRGEIVTLLAWFRAFPDEFLHSRARLCIDYSWPLIFAGEYAAAEALLTRAEGLIPPGSPLLGEILAAQAHLARSTGDLRRAIEASRRALELLPEDHPDIRAVIGVNLGLAYWNSGQISEAEKTLPQALREAESSGNWFAWLSAKVFLGRVYAVKAELKRAYQIYQEALGTGIQAPTLAVVFLDLGALHYEWNELEAARKDLNQGMAIARATGNIDFEAAGYLLLARLSVGLGEWGAAQDWLRQADELAHSRDAQPALKRRIAAYHALAALAQGELERAVELVSALKTDSESDVELDLDPHPFFRYMGLTQEVVLIARGRRAEAAELLAGKYARAMRAGWIYGAITARVYQALAAETPGQAAAFLGEALQRSQAGGFVRTYVDAGRALIPVLVEAARGGIYPETVGRILEAFEASVIPGAALTELLSDRELEVLRLAAAGLANKEIAGKLSISLATVKTHLQHIYGKLGASNRSQAIIRARELKILE